MNRVKVKEPLSIVDAVEYVSSLAELEKEGGGKHFFPGREDLRMPNWLDTTRIRENEDLVREVFEAVKRYFEQISDKECSLIKEEHIRQGVYAIMSFLAEAVEKIENLSEMFKKESGGVTQTKEFQELSEYYLSALASYIPQGRERDDSWEEAWGVYANTLIDVQKKGVRDVIDVKRDHLYELFYIKKEDGTPFYNYDLVRHIKLSYDVDVANRDSSVEDAFMRVHWIHDQDLQLRAKGILEKCGQLLDNFYKDALKYKDNGLISHMSKAVMALMLCANSRNLMQNTTMTKSCKDYFSDFHYYLRQALLSPEYQKVLTPTKSQSFQFTLFLLIHKLCSSYFLSFSNHKEFPLLMRRLLGMSTTKEKTKASFWEELQEEDGRMRRFVEKIHDGPLHKVVDVFVDGENAKGFDPLSQGNTPYALFDFVLGDKQVLCMRLPAPIKQEFIQKAEEVQEFTAYLHTLKIGDKHQKCLLVNLQDRTSWQEFGRCACLERLVQGKAEEQSFYLLGLAKSTDFYFQLDSYAGPTESSLFIQQIKEQINGGEQCGFYIPEGCKDDIQIFSKDLALFIHKFFFDGVNRLEHKDKTRFIEIFYHFIVLKMIGLLGIDYVSFSCKDAIDAGAATSAGFFAFLHLITTGLLKTEEEKNYFECLLYFPALTLRERMVDKGSFSRTVDFLSCMEEKISEERASFTKEMKKLFSDTSPAEIRIL